MRKGYPSSRDGLTANENFIGALVYKYLFPSICAQLGIQLSTLLNSVIIGRVLGSTGLGVASLVSPVSMVYSSIGILISVGASIISGNALGKGDKDRCNQVYTAACFFTLGIAAVLTLAGFYNTDRIVHFLGANADQAGYTRDYIRIYILGSAGPLFFHIPLNYLCIIGKPKLSMVMCFVRTFLNIAGMMIFVVFLGMETGGMALAEVTCGLIACAFGASRLFGKDSSLLFKKPLSGIFHIPAIVLAGSPRQPLIRSVRQCRHSA
jgi:Na+-driven multidrug efflux pump